MAAICFFYRGVTPIPRFKPENPILYLVANLRYYFDKLKRQLFFLVVPYIFLINCYPLWVNQDSLSGHNATRSPQQIGASGKNRTHL